MMILLGKTGRRFDLRSQDDGPPLLVRVLQRPHSAFCPVFPRCSTMYTTLPEDKSMRERPGYFPLLLILAIFFSAPAWADSGKELFEKECSGCHTIGGGDSGGPDLKGITGKRPADWLERVIVEPDKLTADKDPVQLGLVKQYGGEMPNLGISRKDAKKIIAYLQDVSPVHVVFGCRPACRTVAEARGDRGDSRTRRAGEGPLHRRQALRQRGRSLRGVSRLRGCGGAGRKPGRRSERTRGSGRGAGIPGDAEESQFPDHEEDVRGQAADR